MGRTVGSIGIGNIGAEMFRLLKPFDVRMIAHDPYVDAGAAADLGIELVGLDAVFEQSDFLTFNCPLKGDARHRQPRGNREDETERLSHQHQPRASRRPEGSL